MKEIQRKLGQYLCKKWYSLAIFIMVLMGASFCMFDASASALTTVPTKTNFQGRLTNSSGNIMPDGLYNMKFRLFTVNTGGAAVWTETRETTNRVQVTNGLFSVKLGDVTPISASLFASGSLYFEVELPTPGTATCSTAACASFTEGPMTPRNQLATSAYAYNSEALDGLDSSNFVQLGQGVQTDASTASSIFINKTASGNLLQLQSSGADVYTISNTGVVTAGTWQGSTVGVQYGGTGLTGYATGDLLYASGATTLGKLAAVASGSCLTSQGVGTAPGWGSCGLSTEADTLATVTARGATTSTNTSFNGTLTATSDVTFTLAGTENLAISSDLAGTLNVLQVVGTPSATAGTTRGLLVQQADSVNTNGIDSGILVNNADTDLVIANAIQIANSGGGGYTNLINATTFTVTGAGNITNGTWNGSTVGVQYGGTGATTFTSGGLLYGNGTGAIQATAAGGTSQCLMGGATPTWGTCNLQTAYDRSVGETTPEIKLDNTRRGLDIQDADLTINNDLLTVRASNASGLGTALFNVGGTGAILARNSSDTNAAFTISRAGAGGSLFVADTTNSRVQIGNATADSTGIVLVLDTKNTSGDPTGVDGAMYYNSNSRSFRCYQDGSWRACIGGLVAASIGTSALTNNAAANVEQLFTPSHTIAANNCVPGRLYRITSRGTYSSPTLGQPNVTFRLRAGGTSGTLLGVTTGASVASGQTARQWSVKADVICQTTGLSGTVESAGSLSLGTTVTNQNVWELLPSTPGSPVTYDTTSAKALQLSIAFNNNAGDSTFTMRQFIIESMGP